MPNHITNRLKITGPKELVKKIVDECAGDKDQLIWGYGGEKVPNPFDFDKVVPMTDDVKKSMEDPSYYPPGYLENWKSDNPMFTRPMEYWYEWCCDNWGTKWNSYEPSVDEDGSDGKWIVWFDTAWSAPTPVIDALAMKYPGIRIDHRWADEDIGYNCGIRRYRTFMGKVQVNYTDMKGHKRWCRRVKNRSIGND